MFDLSTIDEKKKVYFTRTEGKNTFLYIIEALISSLSSILAFNNCSSLLIPKKEALISLHSSFLAFNNYSSLLIPKK